MNGHTNGPWGAVVGQSADGKCTVGPQNGGIAVERVVAEVNGVANALLIAAAPEMLEALQRLINTHTGATWQTEEVRREAWSQARSAIAKATGTN